MTFEKACKHLIIEQPFFGLFLLQLYKEFSDDVPTLAVAPNNIGVKIIVNPKFWETLNDKEQIAVLVHELSHICFNHILMSKSFDDHELFNIAADAEVNSYIQNLPKGCVKASDFGEPDGKGTMYYYDKIKDKADELKAKYKFDASEVLGNHDFWDQFKDLSDIEKELIKQQIEHQLKETVKQVEKTQGSVPGQFEEYIKNLFKIKEKIFDWKSYFRNMLAGVIDIKLKKTHRRESLRFEGGADIKYKKKTSVLVAIDTSGSISKKELCDFFSEIHHIYKAGAKIRILECDTQINRNYEYHGKWDLKCSGRGGTILKPCSDYYMEHRREYSKFIIFTDGYFDMEDIKTPKSDTIFIITSDGANNKYPGKTIYIPKK